MSWYHNWQARKDARHYRRKRVEEVVSWVCLPVILLTGWLIYDQVRLAVERPDGARAAAGVVAPAEAATGGPRQAVPLTPPAATPASANPARAPAPRAAERAAQR